MRKLFTVIMVLGLMAALTGCGNTVRGMGADIEHAGNKIQNF